MNLRCWRRLCCLLVNEKSVRVCQPERWIIKSLVLDSFPWVETVIMNTTILLTFYKNWLLQRLKELSLLPRIGHITEKKINEVFSNKVLLRDQKRRRPRCSLSSGERGYHCPVLSILPCRVQGYPHSLSPVPSAGPLATGFTRYPQLQAWLAQATGLIGVPPPKKGLETRGYPLWTDRQTSMKT